MTSATPPPHIDIVLANSFGRGLAHAGFALAEMTGREIIVAAPEVRRCEPAEVARLGGGPEAVVVGVYLGLTGSFPGHALLILPPDGARRLAALLLAGIDAGPAPEPTSSMGPLEMSALQELANVTVGAFLNEVGRHLETPAHPTVPQAVVEMAGAILGSVLPDLVSDSDTVLAARTAFFEGSEHVEGALLILPRAESLTRLLAALGVIDG